MILQVKNWSPSIFAMWKECAAKLKYEKLLKMWREGGDNCLAAKELADRHIELLECRIAEIEFMKQALRELTSQCGTGEDCPVIDSMSGKAAPPAKSPRHGCCGLTSSLRNV